MNWYYAVGGQQQGPVDDAQLDALLQSGQITQETLIWREGMANWQPLRQARPSAGAPPVTGGAAAASAAVGGGSIGDVVCAECGKLFTKDNAIQYGTAWVCAACKPIFLQKLREGAPTGGAMFQSNGPFDPAAFLSVIRARDYQLDIGSCLKRAWALVMSNPGTSIGTVIAVYACLMVGSLIPCFGGIIQVVVQGPLMGGMYLVFLKLIRRQETSVGEGFSGFSISFLQLFLVGLVSSILIFACIVPAGLVIGLSAAATKSDPSPVLTGLAISVAAIPVVYLSICWLFSIPLVIDKRIDFWPAMELSRKVVSMHWLSVFLLAVVSGLVVVAGAMALCVGIILAAPVAMAAITYAYEDIFCGGSGTSV